MQTIALGHQQPDHLPKALDVAFFRDVAHVAMNHCEGFFGKSSRLDSDRRERDTVRAARRIPQAGEAALFETIHVDAQRRAVPHRDLRSNACAIHEEKEKDKEEEKVEEEAVATQRITPKLLGHDAEEDIEAFAKDGGSFLGQPGPG